MSLLLPFTGCAAPAKSTAARVADTELSEQLSAGRSAFNRGAWVQAATLYGQALHRAEVMDDPREIANAAYNYGATLLQTGRYDDARAALREARAESARAGAPTADVAVLEARAARLQDKPDDALALADAVLSEKSAAPDVRLQAVLLKGQIACDRNDVSAARAARAQSKPLVGPAGTTPSLAAGIAELEGRIALLDNNPPAAAERFDRQAAFLQRAHLYNDMARALARAGAAYAAANQPSPSADRYYRAARSALAQNELPAARAWLDAASKSADPALAERIAALRKSLPATQPATPAK